MNVAGIALGGLLAVAATAKVWRPASIRMLLGHVGFGRRASIAAGWAIALVEAAIAGWLWSGAATRAAAMAAAGVFALATATLVGLRLRGLRRLACGCFGGGRARPTALLALRAAALTTLAAIVASGRVADVPSPSTRHLVELAFAVLAIAVLALTVLVAGLYREVGVLHTRLPAGVHLELADEGPPLGSQAPALATAGDGDHGLGLVMFLSPACPVCRLLARGLPALRRRGFEVHVLDESGDTAVFERWRVPGTPYAVLVADGVVASKGLVNTLEQLEHLIRVGNARLADHAAA